MKDKVIIDTNYYYDSSKPLIYEELKKLGIGAIVWCNYSNDWVCNVENEIKTIVEDFYDEDETLLTCRNIEFQEGDYIDLRKHTPEQIRHIEKFYDVYKLEETLGEISVEGWIYLVWDADNEFVATTSRRDLGYKEYTYDDIFYLGDN